MSINDDDERAGGEGQWWLMDSAWSCRVELFEKALTPSDVGKLNRLVIPKQQAEKHFPVSGELLGFEDEVGKSWRFRYSYWNSSQSYVLTKGWSRFVKEKRLDAGDTVTFGRHRTDTARLFIGWRRRNTNTIPNHPMPVPLPLALPMPVPPPPTPTPTPTRLRLFGVNLECHPHHHQYQFSTSASNHQMDISISAADIYRQG